MLWFRIASTGSFPERYTLQLPFQFGPSHSLTPGDDNEIAHGELCLELAENHDIHLLRVTGFKTRDEAEAYLPRLRGALFRLIVVKKLSLRTASGLQQVRLYESPLDVSGDSNFSDLFENNGWTHLDGTVDPSPAVVIPEHLRIMESGIGSASVTVSMPIPSFLKQIAEVLSLPQIQDITANERLSLAINLYAASLWETSQRVRVISLVTSLEALLEPVSVDHNTLQHLDRMLETLDSARDHSSESDEQQRAFDRLRSRVAGLKEESISENLRRLAVAHASALGESREEAKRNMMSAYGIRSKSLHHGHAPSEEIASVAEWLIKAVPAVLEILTANASLSV